MVQFNYVGKRDRVAAFAAMCCTEIMLITMHSGKCSSLEMWCVDKLADEGFPSLVQICAARFCNLCVKGEVIVDIGPKTDAVLHRTILLL